jgi:hypothetical protein
MVAGWAFAAWNPASLLVAQFLSGMCMSALEGDMDARVVAANASPRGVTAGLAAAAALSVALVSVLTAGMVVTLARHRSRWALSGTGPAANPG